MTDDDRRGLDSAGEALLLSPSVLRAATRQCCLVAVATQSSRVTEDRAVWTNMFRGGCGALTYCN